MKRGHDPTLLLVSYVEDEREMYATALDTAGFNVLTFTDPLRALDAAMFLRPAAVVTRILQPGAAFNGLELARQLRQDPRTRPTAILAITSLFETVYSPRAAAAGCDVLLTLPCLPSDLVGEVKRVVSMKGRREARS
jgi:two-component system phosphate regulon response regulator PhoB